MLRMTLMLPTHGVRLPLSLPSSSHPLYLDNLEVPFLSFILVLHQLLHLVPH